MAGKVYFGNAQKQSWIKAPLSGMKAPSQGWVQETQLLNGRLHVSSSSASHRRFDASWVGNYNDSDPELSLGTIRDFADGLYGLGPFYYVDPFAAKENILPPQWAAPMLIENDWPNIAPLVEPSFSDSTVKTNSYPIRYAEFDLPDNYESTNKLTLIIPPTHKLQFGWHGPSSAESTGVSIQPYLRTTGEASTLLTPARINVGGTTRVNTTVNGSTYSKVEIYLSTTTAKTVSISAMIAQIIPIAESVEAGGFISGRGITGLQFSQKPQVEYYGAYLNEGHVGLSASWLEVD